MAVKIPPSFDFRCYHCDEFILFYCFIAGYTFPDPGVDTFDRFPGRFDQALAMIFPNVKPQKIKSVINMCNL